MQNHRASAGCAALRRRRAQVIVISAAAVMAAAPMLRAADDLASWDSGSSSWSDAAHWSHSNPAAVGLAPNNGNGSFTFDVQIDNGSISQDIASGVTLQSLRMSNGVIVNASTITLNAGGTISGGAFTGLGTLQLAATGQLTLVNGLFRDLDMLNLANSGTIDIQSTTDYLGMSNGATLRNAGTLLLSDTTGDYTAIGDLGGSGANRLINTGALLKPAGANTTGIGVNVSNDGTIHVSSGGLALHMADGGASNGAFIADGAMLLLSTTAHDFTANSSLSGTGTVQFKFGALGVGGTYNVAATEIAGGTANFNAPATTATLNLSSGAVGGNGTIRLSGGGTWSGGAMNGAGTTLYATGANVNWTGGYKVLAGRTLVNDGTINDSMSGNALLMQDGGTIRNHGTFLFTNDAAIADNGGGLNAFMNSGLIDKSSGAGTAIVGVQFANDGTASVSAGTLFLRMSDAGASNGTFLAEGSGIIAMLGTTHDFSPLSWIDGDGTLAMVGGAANISGHYSIANTELVGGILNFNTPTSAATLNLDGGAVGGSSTLTIASGGVWSAGNMLGAGTTVYAAGASINWIDGYKFLDAHTLINNGTIISSTNGYALFLQNGATVRNAGTLLLSSDTVIADNGGGINAIINSGFISKTAGGGATSLGAQLSNSGTVSVSAGALALTLADGGASGGTFIAGSGATMHFLVSSSHDLTASSWIGGGGTIQFTLGTVSLAGTYAPTTTDVSGGVANFNAGASSGVLNHSFGTIGGSGTLTVTSGGFWSNGSQSGTGTTVYSPAATVYWTDGYKYLDTRTLINSGTILHSAGGYALFMQNGATLRNDGTLLITSDTSIADNGGGTNTLINNGLLQKSGGGLTYINVPVHNHGTVSLLAGSVALGGGGTSGGTFLGAAGTTIVFGGSHTLLSSSSVSTPGAVEFAGTASISGKYNAGTTLIDAGQIVRVSGGSILRTNNLLLAGATDAWLGKLDLAGGELIVDYTGDSPLVTIKNQLDSGRNAGSWDGSGITASTIDPLHAVGIAEASALFGNFPADLNGQALDNSAVIVKFTFAGDTNLDAMVDLRDLYALATHYKSSGQSWITGDCNDDGKVDLSDLTLLARNWQAGVNAPLSLSLGAALSLLHLPVASVPEPTALLGLLSATTVLWRRRRVQ